MVPWFVLNHCDINIEQNQGIKSPQNRRLQYNVTENVLAPLEPGVSQGWF